jgi:hypothetical protein
MSQSISARSLRALPSALAAAASLSAAISLSADAVCDCSLGVLLEKIYLINNGTV